MFRPPYATRTVSEKLSGVDPFRRRWVKRNEGQYVNNGPEVLELTLYRSTLLPLFLCRSIEFSLSEIPAPEHRFLGCTYAKFKMDS